MNTVHEGFLNLGEATIALQPIFDLENYGTVGFFEATLRIRGTPDPIFHARLIALGERLGFIHFLDMHVMGMTAATLRRHPEMRASFNVSQRSILEDGQQLIRDLEASQVAHRMIVEITESAEIPVSWAAAFAAGVREVGALLAIDDYETGSANDNLVRAVRPDIIKVVVDDVSDAYHERIMRTVDLAREIGADVVGEKIDSEEKIALVRDLGVRYLQGFSLSLPILDQDISAVLRQSAGTPIAFDERYATGIRGDLALGGKAFNGDRQIRLVQEA